MRDNLIAAAQEFRGSLPARLFAKPDAGLGGRADEMIDLFRLNHVAGALAGTLSYGQQKLIDIAMAFMAAPRLVLLDEPRTGGAMILPDGSVRAGGEQATRYAGEAVAIIDRWTGAGRPPMQAWWVRLALSGDPQAPIWVPTSWQLPE